MWHLKSQITFHGNKSTVKTKLWSLQVNPVIQQCDINSRWSWIPKYQSNDQMNSNIPTSQNSPTNKRFINIEKHEVVKDQSESNQFDLNLWSRKTFRASNLNKEIIPPSSEEVNSLIMLKNIIFLFSSSKLLYTSSRWSALKYEFYLTLMSLSRLKLFLKTNNSFQTQIFH